MRRDRGISQIEIGIVLGIIVVMAISAWRLYEHGDKTGYTRAMSEVSQRDNQRLTTALARVRELEEERAQAEKRHADRVAEIDAAGQKEVRRVEAAKDQFVHDVVTGKLRLFDPTAKSCPGGGDDPGASAVAGPGVGDGAGGAQLSREASIFLLEEAARADQVVVKLSACQKVLAADREVGLK